MAIGTTIQVGFNSSAVQAGFKKIGAGFKGMTRGFANAGRAMLAPFVKLMAVMAPIIGAAGMARGIKDILDYGGAVSDLANRLGISAAEIVVLEEAFRQTGVEAKDVATTLQRMGKNIETGLELPTSEAGKALAAMGLTIEVLQGMNLAQKFEAIGKKIGEVKDAGTQARLSMALFGREGASLVNTFKTGGIFDDARKNVGGLGEKMNEMANSFDYISDSIAGIGLKMRQFFAGVTAEILPTLNKLADFINGVDLTGFGEKLGSAMETLFATARNGSLGDLLWEGFKFALQRSGEVLFAIMDEAAERLADAIEKRMKNSSLGYILGMEDELGPSVKLGPELAPMGSALSSVRVPKTIDQIMGSTSGMLGSDKSFDAIKSIAAAVNTHKQESWLKEIGWSNKEILAAIKQQSQYMRNSIPSIPR